MNNCVCLHQGECDFLSSRSFLLGVTMLYSNISHCSPYNVPCRPQRGSEQAFNDVRAFKPLTTSTLWVFRSEMSNRAVTVTVQIMNSELPLPVISNFSSLPLRDSGATCNSDVCTQPHILMLKILKRYVIKNLISMLSWTIKSLILSLICVLHLFGIRKLFLIVMHACNHMSWHWKHRLEMYLNTLIKIHVIYKITH